MPSSSLVQPLQPRHCFVVGLDGEGRWVARDEQGQTGGVFADRIAAVHFAAIESNHQAGAIRFAPASVRISLLN